MNFLFLNSRIRLSKEAETSLATRGHQFRNISFEAGNPANKLSDLLRAQKDFQPDVILVWSADYQGIPVDIEEAPCRTVAMINDYHICWSSLWPHLRRFDAIWTDQLGKETLRAVGFEHFIDSPIYSYAGDIPKIGPTQKDLDVLFLGGNNFSIHRERSFWLRRLARMADRHRILIGSGIYGEAYYQHLSRAKILFNHGVRHEMNMRCFEAAAVGSLLMMERENREVWKYFPDGQAAVSYGPEDFEEKVEYYLAHEQEREQIVENAKPIAQKMLEEQFFKFAEQVSRLPEANSANRKFTLSPGASKWVAIANNWIHIEKTQFGSLRAAVQNAQQECPQNSGVWNTSALVELASPDLSSAEPSPTKIQNIIDGFNRAISSNAKYLPARLSLANLFLGIGRDTEAKKVLLELKDLASREHFEESELEGMTYPGLYDPFRVARERFFAIYASDVKKSLYVQKQLFLIQSSLQLSQILSKENNFIEALTVLLDVLEFSVELDHPFPTIFSELAKVSWDLGDFESSISYGEIFDRLSPLDPKHWREHCSRIALAATPQEAAEKASEYETIAKAYAPAEIEPGYFLAMLEAAAGAGRIETQSTPTINASMKNPCANAPSAVG